MSVYEILYKGKSINLPFQFNIEYDRFHFQSLYNHVKENIKETIMSDKFDLDHFQEAAFRQDVKLGLARDEEGYFYHALVYSNLDPMEAQRKIIDSWKRYKNGDNEEIQTDNLYMVRSKTVSGSLSKFIAGLPEVIKTHGGDFIYFIESQKQLTQI